MAKDANSSKDNQDQQTKEKQRVDYSYENTSLFSIQTPIRFSKEHNERTYVEFMLDKSSKVDKIAKLTNNYGKDFDVENITANRYYTSVWNNQNMLS